MKKRTPIIERRIFWNTYHQYGKLHATLSPPMLIQRTVAHEIAVFDDGISQFGNGYYIRPWSQRDYLQNDPLLDQVQVWLTGRDHCELNVIRTSGYRHVSDPEAYQEIMKRLTLHSDRRGPESRARNAQGEWPHDWRQR